MDIKVIKTGYLEENCYVLIKDNNALVIDPGDDYDKIKTELKDYNLVGVLITHNHFDHVGSLKPLLKDYKINCYDYNNLKEKKYTISSFNFEVIYTPGHSKDSISFYFEKENILFSGDFIFKGTIGRMDLEGGSISDMKKSLLKLDRFNKDVLIYPGHGDKTLLKDERNIYKLILLELS